MINLYTFCSSLLFQCATDFKQDVLQKFIYYLNLIGIFLGLFYTGAIAPCLIWHNKKKIVLFIVKTRN